MNKSLIYNNGDYKKWVGKSPGESESFTSIPIMTSNTAPVGIVSSSSVFSEGYQPFLAFNGVLGDPNNCWYSSTSSNEWIAYEFVAPIVINKYSISSGNSALNVMPKDFTFDGYDGNNWFILDTQENVSNWVSMEYLEFPIRNNKPFIKYRLSVKNNNGNGSYVGIADTKMFKATSDYSDVEGWMSVGLNNIISEGVDSLSTMLDRKVKSLDAEPMIEKTDILSADEEGKVFGKVLDLKKYIDIRSVNVEVK